MIKNENLTMLTDFYEITMANGYLQSGSMKEDIAYFDMFFRKVPDGGGYAIMAGVEQVIDYLKNLKFTEEDIAFLRSKGIFCEEFLDYLRDCLLYTSEIIPGDLLRVLPGEKIPADGVIVEGNTSVDQSVMTGESIPVDKEAGEEVFCGTVNCYGAIDMEATRVGEDSSLQKLIQMVKDAENKKAPMQRTADKWAIWLVPIALFIAAAAFAVTWLMGFELKMCIRDRAHRFLRNSEKSRRCPRRLRRSRGRKYHRYWQSNI